MRSEQETRDRWLGYESVNLKYSYEQTKKKTKKIKDLALINLISSKNVTKEL